MAKGSPTQSRVVVIGAGVMGSGIAAHMANLGWSVSVLDVPPSEPSPEDAAQGLTLEDEVVRNRLVRQAWDRAKGARPPHFHLRETAETVRLGNTDDNLDWVKDADWVVEAIVEKVDAKRALYEKLEPLLAEETLITTNTSGLSIRELSEGRSESFRKRFVGTHFFNPPRYLKLMEVIPTPATDPAILKKVLEDAETAWGKRVVLARDTPGFIANRIGMFGMVQAVHAALDARLTVEEADALTGLLIGRPKSASFRLNDIVGLDIMEDVAGNQYRRLSDDKFRECLILPAIIKDMIQRRWLGNKTGQGFYKREGQDFFALDMETMEYRPMQKPKIEGLDELAKTPWQDRLNTLLLRQDKYGKFLRSHLLTSLVYAAYTAPDISDTIVGVDRVMRWGFGWEKGPFELIDEIGVKPFIDFCAAQGLQMPRLIADLHDSGAMTFYERQGGKTVYFDMAAKKMTEWPAEPKSFSVNELKETRKPLSGNGAASIFDLGDKTLLVEFHTKMNALEPDVVEVVLEAVERAEKAGHGLVLANDGRAFSAGFNLSLFLNASTGGEWKVIDGYIRGLQAMGKALRYSTVPTVAAVHGYVLGGGCECAMHCNVVVADPDVNMGLPETNVGVIPAAGGTSTFVLRNPGIEDRFEAWKILRAATVATNAAEAKKLGYLAENDVISFNPDHRLQVAKKLAQSKVTPRRYEPVPGHGGAFMEKVDAYMAEERAAGRISEYDRVLGRSLAGVMCSFAKLLSEDEMHEKEREIFVDLCKNIETRERIQAMLETGKPLKN